MLECATGRGTYVLVPPPGQEGAVHDPCFGVNGIHLGEVGLDQGGWMGDDFCLWEGFVGKATGCKFLLMYWKEVFYRPS